MFGGLVVDVADAAVVAGVVAVVGAFDGGCYVVDAFPF